MTAMAEVRAAGLIVFRELSKNIEYLLMQTSYGIHHWTPPKGHLEEGENDMQAALRETSEEAGLAESDFDVLPGFKKELKYTVKGKPKVVTYWLAKVREPLLKVTMSHEHQDYKWVSLDQACQLVSDYADMVQALHESQAYLKTL